MLETELRVCTEIEGAKRKGVGVKSARLLHDLHLTGITGVDGSRWLGLIRIAHASDVYNPPQEEVVAWAVSGLAKQKDTGEVSSVQPAGASCRPSPRRPNHRSWVCDASRSAIPCDPSRFLAPDGEGGSWRRQRRCRLQTKRYGGNPAAAASSSWMMDPAQSLAGGGDPQRRSSTTKRTGCPAAHRRPAASSFYPSKSRAGRGALDPNGMWNGTPQFPRANAVFDDLEELTLDRCWECSPIFNRSTGTEKLIVNGGGRMNGSSMNSTTKEALHL